jgi:hypothetical protein
MPPGRRALTVEQLTACRIAYERDGASYRELGAQYGCSHSTIRALLAAVGVQSRPVGWPHWKRPPQPEPEAPQARPAVEVAPDVTGRLRIPWRSREERRVRDWTAAERRAIAVEVAAGRVMVAPRGRSGLPERPSRQDWTAAGVAFHRAMRRLREAA